MEGNDNASGAPSQPDPTQEAVGQPSPIPEAQPTTPEMPVASEVPIASEAPISAEGGIFSGSDTRIETENLPEVVPEVSNQAPLSAISRALRTESTVTGDLQLGGPAKKKKWPIIALVVGVVAVVVVITLLIGRNFTSKTRNIVGDINLNYLFDETAPIPVEQSGQYGYIDPENGGWIVTPQYLTASSFYGDYAAVSFSQANRQKVAIINRSGEIVVVQENGSVDAYYDIENNIWVVGGDIYDSSMKKLNADGVTGNYIGNGYILSSVQIEKSVSELQEDASSEEDSEDDTAASLAFASDGDDTYIEVVGKIEDLKGNVRYDCQAFCIANTTSDGDGRVYAVVRNWGEPAKIIKLPSGEILYTASGSDQIRILHDVIFVEGTGSVKKYLTIENDKVSIIGNQVKDALVTISNAGEYYAEECNGRNSILKVGGEAIMKCDVSSYTELSETTYLMYQSMFSKAPLFIERENKVELVDLRKVDTLQTFELGSITVYDDSPFFYVLSDSGVARVCNLLKGIDKCIEIEDANADVAGFGNYFTVTLGDDTKIYNANLEKIHE